MRPSHPHDGARDNQSVQGVPEQLAGPADRAEFRHLPGRGGVELYRAHIVRHAFDPHTHAAYGLGCIEAGVERFRYRGGEHLAPPGALVTMNPDELHTGRAETVGGWRYRMVYLDAEVLEAATGERGWWFAQPVAEDALAARRVRAALGSLWQAKAALEADAALVDLLDALRPHACVGVRAAAEQPVAGDAPLARAIGLMQDRLAEPLTLAELAAAAGLSPFHFLRRFKAGHGATPHQMLMALRLFRAKQQLAAGVAPAQVAADVGLVDQAHLTRRFGRMYGVTPARYQQQLGTRPARAA